MTNEEGVCIGCLIDNYSKDSLERIVNISDSMADLSRRLGYKTSHGKNYETIQKRLDEFNINTEHFKLSHINKIFTDKDVFCRDSIVSQKTVRKFYLKRDDIEYKCVKCGVGSIWNNTSLTLQLDHIDGNNNNNLLENLRWLCPNCHSQTKTFAGKNIQKEKNHYYCIDCGKEIDRNSERCRRCASILRRKRQRPSKEELEQLLKSHNGGFTAVAEIYNVRDNTIRKWCKFYELPTRSSYYMTPKQHKEPKPIIMYAVEQIDMSTGEVIASFISQQEAEKTTGICHISEASNPNNTRRKSAGGYFWRRK